MPKLRENMSSSILSVPFPRKFASLRTFITTSSCGDAKDPAIRKKICETLGMDFEKVVSCKQVHGIEMMVVREEHVGKQFEAADGLVTLLSGVPLIVFVADCIPIFLYDPVAGAAGIIHAGRAGTMAGISRYAVERMRNSCGTESSNIYASFGPSICGKCYPVDLEGLNRRQLEEEGVAASNIHVMGLCTFEDADFFSYRRDKTAERMLAVIMKA